MILIYKLLGLGALLGALWWLWDSDRDRHAAAAVEAAVKPIRELGIKVAAERDQLAKDKQTTADQAQAAFDERKRKDDEREQADKLRDAAHRVALERVRASAVGAGGRRVDEAAANTCSAEHQQRDERFDGLLAEGQSLGIEVRGLGEEVRQLVGEGERGLGRAASLIELAREWGRAVRLGEKP